MQIVEIKNNLAKIIYNPASEHLVLSGFVTLQDQSQMFIAQVINLDAKTDNHFAILKMLFTFDEKGFLSPYNGAIPSLESSVQVIDTQQILGLIEVVHPIYLGDVSEVKHQFKLDLTFFDKSNIVCVDNNDEKNSFIKTILPQILEYGKNVVIFDLMGDISFQDKLVAGRDFKLPLNYDTINFIYEKGLSDASGETKALIQDIFIEVQNYVKEIPEKFIPFQTFKSVVDTQYEELKLNELVLLKNKLLKYYENGVFAQEQSEFETVKTSLLTTPLTVIDISTFDGILQREVISYVYSVMKEIGSQYYSILQIDDDNTDKKLLKQVFVTQNVNTIFTTQYKYKYLKEIKQLSKNLILFAPIQQQDDFAGYNVFLSKLNHKELIVYGEKTQYIPFIVSLVEQPLKNEQPQDIDEVQEEVQKYQEEVQEYQEEVQEYQEQIQSEIQEVEQEHELREEVIEDIQPQLEENDILEDQTISDEQIIEHIEQPQDIDEVQEEVQEYQEEIQNEIQEEVQEFREEVLEDIPSHVEETQEDIQQKIIDQNINQDMQRVEESIIRDLDKMESIPASDVQMNTEILTDEDLDFIQENIQSQQVMEGDFIPPVQEGFEDSEEFISPVQQVVNDEEQLISPIQQGFEDDEEFISPVQQVVEDEEQLISPVQEGFEDGEEFISPVQQVVNEEEQIIPPSQEDFIPAQTQDEISETITPQNQQNNEQVQEFRETPIVPIYPSEQNESPKSNVQFVQGDVVMHETYGKGVVAKIISYGDKVLCSIEFETAGKKLLDPAITQLEKL